MIGYNIHLTTLYFLQRDNLWLFLPHHHEAAGSLLNITAVPVQFFGNLFVGQIQRQEIEEQYPYLEGLMVSGKNGVRHIIEALMTIFALITMSTRRLFVGASSDESPGGGSCPITYQKTPLESDISLSLTKSEFLFTTR